MKDIFNECRKLLPPPVSDKVWLPYLAPALDAGMATFCFVFVCLFVRWTPLSRQFLGQNKLFPAGTLVVFRGLPHFVL